MGFFDEMKETGASFIKKGAAASSKDEIIADALFSLISAKGLPMKNTRRDRDIHYAEFEVGENLLYVTIARRASQNPRIGFGPLSVPLGIMPTVCDITFRVCPKTAGLLAKMTGAGKMFKYVLNADEYIDDDLKIKDQKALQQKFAEYLKSTGL